MTYSVDHILEIINMYHINIININEYKKEYRSVGISVITDEISGSSGTSDPVQSEALSHVHNDSFYTDIVDEINYLHKRIHLVSSGRNKEVLNLRMNGDSAKDISEKINLSVRTVYTTIERVAMEINGIARI